MTATIIRSPWESEFRELVRSAGERLIISAPFITKHGWRALEDELAARDVSLRVSTSLRARAASTGALDVAVLAEAHGRVPDIELRNVLGLHAKVYVADDRAAIITSGNLTRASLRNLAWRIPLTYCVPFLVATFGALGNARITGTAR